MIKNFTLFESNDIKYINVAIDASASCLSLLNNIFYMIDFGDYDKINLITFNDPPTNYKVVDHIDINKIKYLYGSGAMIPVIDFIIKNGLNKYKTFIISDFFISDKPDYDNLIDYELINILDLYDKIDKYNL